MESEQSQPGADGGNLSRRGLLKTAAAAAILPAIAGCAVSGRGYEEGLAGATEGTPKAGPLRIGLIGCGGRGTGAAVQALRADRDSTLVSMGDVFPDRLESSLSEITSEMGAEGQVRVRVPPERRFLGFDAYQRVIDSGVDIVLLTAYPQFRPAHLKAAVEAGKHVFAEKPVAVDAPGVRSVLESAKAAKARGLAVVVGFCWRYHPGMRGVFKELRSGRIGDVVAVHTTYHTSTLGKRPRRPEWTDMEFQLRNWWHFTWLSGDHMVEQAVHSVDRLSWAMGDRLPARVICLGGRAARSGPEHGNVFDHFAAVYEYEDGLRCYHTTRQIDGCPSDNTDYVYCTKGRARINGWSPPYALLDNAGKEVWSYKGALDRDMYQVEHDELFASIRAGRPLNTCERGARSTLMAIMARMAAYTGQTVTWEQALNSKEDLTPGRYEFGPVAAAPVAVPGKTKFV